MSGPIQAVGQLVEGQAAYKAGKFNNRVAQINAQQEEADAAAEGERVRANARQIAGEAIAAQGASGFALGTGSALEALRETAINSELDVMTLRRKGAISAASTRTSGALALMQGKAARTGSFFKAAGTVAKSVEQQKAAG